MSKVLLYCFIGLFVIYFSYGAGNYPVSSQITRNTDEHGAMTPISQKVLPEGLHLDDVETKLREEDFIRDEAASHKNNPSIVESAWGEKEKTHYIFSKDVSSLVCKERMYVDVHVNNKLQLISASGTIREFGCL